MKTFTIRGLIAIVAIALQINFANAQFTVLPNGIGNFLRTSVLNQSVGIGVFTVAIRPQSALHVNTNLTFLSPDFNRGETFRTTGPNNQLNAWRLWTGGQKGGPIASEKFSLQVPANSNNVIFQASQEGAMMQFNITGTGFFLPVPISRMVITDGAGFGNTGLIGMGNFFTSPQSQLHINDGFFATYLQITNFNTNPLGQALNPTATDGFKLGIDVNGVAELRQQENADMNFYTGTGGNQRMVIKGITGPTQGFVGIGTNFTTPLHLLDVRNGDINTGNGTPQSPQGYMIGDNYVLRHRGITSSINVGVLAGPVNTGANNVFVGNQAGLSNTTGHSNVFIGFRSGSSNTTGRWNTFTGLVTGEDNTVGRGNSFYGKDAGQHNTNGNWNSFYGACWAI